MKKNQRLNRDTIKQFVVLYQIVSEVNDLDLELSELIKNNRPEDSEIIKEKYETFFNKYKEVGKQVSSHLALANNFSSIFDMDINALAIERTNLAKKSRAYPIGKKYLKLRIYYQAVDNRYYKGHRIDTWTYPNFGMLLICSLMFNDHIFKFEIAKTGKGCDKIWSCEGNVKDAIIINKSRSYLSSQSKELKFCSSEKFTEVLNICETVTQLINIELEKVGLGKLVSNVEISEE